MTVKIEIRGTNCRIGNVPESILMLIRNECSYKVKGAEKSKLYQENKWDGYRRHMQTDGLFPLGLLPRVTSMLGMYGLAFEIDKKKQYKPMPISEEAIFTAELRDYQQEAVDKILDNKMGILQVATGGGKTVIASNLIYRIGQKTMFMVHTKDLMYQAKKEIEKFTGLEVGQVGDGVIDIRDVTVATMQSISMFMNIKYVKSTDESDQKEKKLADSKVTDNKKNVMEMIRSTRVLIWDETHRIACEMAMAIAKKIDRTEYRIGLSASPWRDDGADLDIESAIGSVIYRISASDLIEQGHLVAPIIKIDKINSKAMAVGLNKLPYDTVYKMDISENWDRNQRIVDYYKNFTSLGIPTLILVKNIKHGNMLKKMIETQYDPITFLSGRDASTKRNDTIEELRAGERIGLIASTIADEGLDIKRLGAVILAGGGKSTTRALQRIGRAIRPFEGKEFAQIVDFDDQHPYLSSHSQMRLVMYQTEPRFIILRSGVTI